MRLVIYTAIFGGYDDLKEPYISRTGARMVCITDMPGIESRSWETVVVKREFDDPVRDARMRKVLAHRMFPDADVTVWVDANLELIKAFPENAVRGFLGSSPMMLCNHDVRHCVYDEADKICELRLDDRRVVAHQMARYREDGFPKKAGLVWSGFIVRRRCPETDVFNEAWWAEIKGGSRRDQLSLDYCLWKTGVSAKRIECNPDGGKFFLHRTHKGKRT